MSSGPGSLICRCWLSNYWFLRGLDSLLHYLLFCIYTHFSGSLAKTLQTIFYEMVRSTTSKTIFIFPLIQLDHIGKMDNIPDWSAPPTPPVVSVSSPAEDTASSSPCGFVPESSSASLLSTVANWVVKVQLPFNFWEGNKFPGVWEWVKFDPPVVVVLGSRGFMASGCLSNFWDARSRLEYLVGCSESTLWTNIHWYLGFSPSKKQSHFISSTCSCWILPWYSDWSIWTCCNRCTPNLATFSPDPCLRE